MKTAYGEQTPPKSRQHCRFGPMSCRLRSELFTRPMGVVAWWVYGDWDLRSPIWSGIALGGCSEEVSCNLAHNRAASQAGLVGPRSSKLKTKMLPSLGNLAWVPR